MYDRTAIVIGATGLVGIELVQLLLEDQRFSHIKVLTRRNLELQNEKLEEYLVDFNLPDSWSDLVSGDVLFSVMGTTLKTAGSKSAQYLVDHTYQYQVAAAAAKNDVPVYVLVSSAMADPKSRIFYTRMKGELERDISQLPFKYIHILQPGMLKGKRKENRPGEKAALNIMHFLNKLGILKKQRPIPVKQVAQAMINVSFQQKAPINTYALQEVFQAADDHEG